MLAIVSDLHLSDGTTASNLHETALGLLCGEIMAAAEKRGAREIHLVLLGDIVDLVRTDWWHRQGIPADQRPWGGTLRPDTAMNQNDAEIERQFCLVLDATVRTAAAQALFTMMRTLRQRGVPVRVTYVVGNHDRMLNNYPGLKTRFQRECPEDVPVRFALKLDAPEYGVLARHGHEWDGHCHAWEFMKKVLKKNRTAGRFDPAAYQVMAIGEVVTAELMSGLVFYAQQQLDLRKPADTAFLALLREINNVRPMTDTMKWLGWMTRQQLTGYIPIVEQALLKALDGVLDNSFAGKWDALEPEFLIWGDLTDWLNRVRRAVKKDGLISVHNKAMTLAKLAERPVAVYNALVGKGAKDTYEDGAEDDLGEAGDAVRFVVYGHTHTARRRCLVGDPEGASRLYLNTGTYMPLVERAKDGRSFWRAHRMSVLFAFRKDEDTEGRKGAGPTLDVWDGVRVKEYADG